MLFTASSWWTAAVETTDTIVASSSVLARTAGTLVDLDVAELTRVAGHTLADVVTVAVDARAVVTVDRRTAVNHVLAPVAVVACTPSLRHLHFTAANFIRLITNTCIRREATAYR